MRVTAEEINGKKYTVIYPLGDISKHEIDDAVWVIDWRGVRVAINKTSEDNEYVIAYALPALPHHPKPEDADLLYRYLSEGIKPYLVSGARSGSFYALNPVNHDWLVSTHWGDDETDGLGVCNGISTEITHATFRGQLVEIAIESVE
jgi:hypothetical protein